MGDAVYELHPGGRFSPAGAAELLRGPGRASLSCCPSNRGCAGYGDELGTPESDCSIWPCNRSRAKNGASERGIDSVMRRRGVELAMFGLEQFQQET
jgi:hypothetical protein